MFPFKKKETLEEKVLLIQQGNEQVLQEVLTEYQPFIKKSISSVCKRYITDSDDEYSIGMIAFHEALQLFDETKGQSLLAFADTIIKRKVIDYIRKQVKEQHIHLDVSSDTSTRQLDDIKSSQQYFVDQESVSRKEQILIYAKKLEEFDISFAELVKISPKHQDARNNAIAIAKLIAKDEELWQYCTEKKRLPLKKLEEKVRVSRKTMERNRKYIIAITIIFVYQYTFLMEYIKGRG
ncbi:RNA polymerase sigma-I factor [Mangrovibacillus cuniculi]|uniref:RNA polymerase sigma factor SigI n=1 Tax=Mangrovibacillus cuniculi TaxID=2593652 RepID=A0A7S8CE80_9BACI|nr:RNA polymerase sigma-I factor [Mangrovibacillus cuniculi]QPC48348.1 RNA polymerase sigma-I factor [Mangrovibacillus cuniculi]